MAVGQPSKISLTHSSTLALAAGEHSLLMKKFDDVDNSFHFLIARLRIGVS
jgi:hypothetical protein